MYLALLYSPFETRKGASSPWAFSYPHKNQGDPGLVCEVGKEYNCRNLILGGVC